MKIAVFAINFLIQIVVAVFGLFTLLLALNGYSESQASAGIYLFIGLSIVSAFALAVASSYAAGRLVAAKPALGRIWSALIAVIIFAIIGVVVVIVGLFAAIFLTEAMRVK